MTRSTAFYTEAITKRQDISLANVNFDHDYIDMNDYRDLSVQMGLPVIRLQ